MSSIYITEICLNSNINLYKSAFIYEFLVIKAIFSVLMTLKLDQYSSYNDEGILYK